jgi:secreted trypsin-like serine protease
MTTHRGHIYGRRVQRDVVRNVMRCGTFVVLVVGLLSGSASVAAAQDAQADDIPFEASVVNGAPLAFDASGVVGLVPAGTVNAAPRDVRCHGALVSERIVVTAAHCIDTGDVDVVLLATTTETIPGGTVTTTNVVRQIAVGTATQHPEFDPTTLLNDVAVLTLAETVAATEASRVQLPVNDTAATTPGNVLYAAGMGCNRWDASRGCTVRTGVMSQASLPAISGAECRSLIASTIGARFDEVTQLCAGARNSIGRAADTCFGDSGTPLVSLDPVSGRATMVGITSYGLFGCGYLPGVYTRVTGVRSWIDQAMQVGAGRGYWLVDAEGRPAAFGAAPSVSGPAPASGAVRAVWDGNRLLTVFADGTVRTSRGIVQQFALQPGERLVTLLGGAGVTSAGRIVGSTAETRGFADLTSMGASGTTLNAPIIDAVPTASGRGAWMVAADGGVFSLGDAAFHGSTGAMRINSPVVGLASTPSGRGYWLVAADGGVFAFGDAAFRGSMGGTTLNAPVVGMVSDGAGYLLVAADGGVFNYGDTPFAGSLAVANRPAPIVSVATYLG